jgi:hypothetical protein
VITASEAAETLRLLVPGFVALTVFYWLGLRTKRTDLEWTLWSLLAAAVIDALIDPLVHLLPGLAHVPRLLIGLTLGVVVGLLLAVAWHLLIGRVPTLRVRASRMAWDAILPKPHWVQVWTTDGKTVSGKVALLADPVETDELDLYLTEPAWIDASNKPVEMAGVEGFLIARSSIAYIQVFAPDATTVDDAAHGSQRGPP